MDPIKIMDSLPILREIKALVKTIKLKARKIKTSCVSVVELVIASTYWTSHNGEGKDINNLHKLEHE